MKFEIKRVSDWKRERAPVPSAVRGGVHRGTRQDGSQNIREGWIVELNTLEDLLALEKEAESNLIVSGDSFEMVGYQTELDLPEITIYDGHME